MTDQQVESSRWLRALQVQRTRTAAAFTSRDYPLNPLCARRVTEPCLTSVSRSPRQGERTFDTFCLATTFCHQETSLCPTSASALWDWMGSRTPPFLRDPIVRRCLNSVWFGFSPPPMDRHCRQHPNPASAQCATATFARAHPANGKKGTCLKQA